jgi:hypothetical protein
MSCVLNSQDGGMKGTVSLIAGRQTNERLAVLCSAAETYAVDVKNVQPWTDNAAWVGLMLRGELLQQDRLFNSVTEQWPP